MQQDQPHTTLVMSETTLKQSEMASESNLPKKESEIHPSEILPSSDKKQVKNSYERLRRMSGKAAIDKSMISLTYNNMKFEAPPDFRELLAVITKTVLEEQPSNIPLFLARYFKELDKDNVYQKQKARIQAEKDELERIEMERIKAEKQAAIKKRQTAMRARQQKMAIMKANILAEAERQRQADEKELQDNATYFAEEIIKQANSIRKEQILRENHKIGLLNLEQNKSDALTDISEKIETLESQTEYLDECMDTIYNHQIKVHEESMHQHQLKIQEYTARLVELAEFIEKVSGIVEKLNEAKPTLVAEREAYIQNIDRLHVVKHDLVKDYNSKIIQLEVEFKDELELIHKYLT